MQMDNADDGLFSLEYCDGIERYRATANVSRKDAEQALLDYYGENESWKDRFQWEAAKTKGDIGISIAIIAVVVAVIAYLLAKYQ